MRYSLCLSYDGSAFCGWQIQPNAPSVQASLEATLSRLMNRPVAVTGAGRTDTGVHASGYVAHFDWDGMLPFEASDFVYKLNAMLPRGIVVHSVSEAAADFHARFSARRREYTYFIHRKKDPFADRFSYLYSFPTLDVDAMNEAARAILGTHDFSCFEKTGSSNKTSICTVYEAHWETYTPTHVSLMGYPADEGDYLYFRISADRFLRNMVRAVVGTLLEVGRGRRPSDSLAELISTGTRCDAGESVPGHALFLSGVDYSNTHFSGSNTSDSMP
jgi:tRNA pseudouridine38-40 synthase